MLVNEIVCTFHFFLPCLIFFVLSQYRGKHFLFYLKKNITFEWNCSTWLFHVNRKSYFFMNLSYFFRFCCENRSYFFICSCFDAWLWYASVLCLLVSVTPGLVVVHLTVKQTVQRPGLLIHCWASVADGVATLRQHTVNVSYILCRYETTRSSPSVLSTIKNPWKLFDKSRV